MDRQLPRRPHRDARYMDAYRGESRRMHEDAQTQPEPQNEAQPQPPEPPQNRDAAVILPLLLLLMREGADRYLLLALLYILM